MSVNYKFIEYKKFNKIDISIVMTTCDRKKQTLFTLNTIDRYKKDNMEVIIVDDYNDELYNNEDFIKFGYNIKYIRITGGKDWINPCVNYNIGFKFIDKDSKIVIIQNAEVCHVGNVIGKYVELVNDDNYIICDVSRMITEEENELIYQDINNIKNFLNLPKRLFIDGTKCTENWYHYLTCITKKNLDKLKGFDVDFAQGISSDDDEFILRILHILKLKIVYIGRDLNNLEMGIHLWHKSIFENRNEKEYTILEKRNRNLLEKKKQYYNFNKK